MTYSDLDSKQKRLAIGVYAILVTFLIAGTEYLMPKIKGQKLYLSQFLEVTAHNRLAPRQHGITENSSWQEEGGKAKRDLTVSIWANRPGI